MSANTNVYGGTIPSYSSLSGLESDDDVLIKFIGEHGGKRVIKRILIANNGLAAVKEIRSVRKWAYSTFRNDRIVKFIAMASPEDIAANAEFVRMADEYVSVPGGPNNLNYANVPLIVEIAQRVNAHAVWAGWGHASENPRLPDSLKKVGISFIGPPAGAMQALGDKISSMIVAQSAYVPCLPWSGTGIAIKPDECGHVEEVEKSIYSKACVSNLEEGIEAAKKVGYPLMIKASEGGGGKGIRRVDDAADFAINFDFVQREVPGSPIFLMQLAREARHLEVQILADEYGQAVSIYGRDCSVQRRHQKIIEEAPVTVVNDYSEWEEMERAAVRLAKMVGYVSTGTVEYLYDVTKECFSFLELNPRLQVEHPCTEMISGVNLPACQLQVAMGIPLHCIIDIRQLYGRGIGTSLIDFDNEAKRVPNGHVVACRITAENPEVGFKPGGGKVQELTFRSSDDVWAYFNISSLGNVHEYADSQIGHVFAWGPNRIDALMKMVMALKEISFRAEFRTTVEYLIRLLETDAFQGGTHSTAWLDGLIKNRFGQTIVERDETVIGASSWYAFTETTHRFEQAKLSLQRGQAPASIHLDSSLKLQFIYNQIQYEIKVKQVSYDRFILEMCGTRLSVKALRLSDDGLLISAFGGRTLLVYGKEEPQGLRLTLNGNTIIIEKENDPTVVRSPSPGKLVRYLVKENVVYPAGTAIAEIEIMKMYMPLLIPEAGSILPTKAAGSSIEAGEIIAKIKLLDPTSVTKATLNVEGFTTIKPAIYIGHTPYHQYEELLRIIENSVINGYHLEIEDNKLLIGQFISIILDERLPFYLVLEVLSKTLNRLPARLADNLAHKINAGISNGADMILLSECLEILTTHHQTCDPRDAPIILELINTIKPHLGGPIKFAEKIISDLCERFLNDAALFDNAPTVDIIIRRLSETHGTNYGLSTKLYIAWASGEQRQILFGHLLKEVMAKLVKELGSDSQMIINIRRLMKLSDKSFSRISQAAREAIMVAQLPSIQELRSEMESQFNSLIKTNVLAEREMAISRLVAGLSYHMDVLPTFFLHTERSIRLLAIEIYVRRVFEAFDFVKSSSYEDSFSWVVSAPPTLTERSRTSHSLAELHRRAGIFAAFDNAEALQHNFEFLVCRLEPEVATKNVVYFAIPDEGHDDQACISSWQSFLESKSELLVEHDIKRLTIVLVRSDSTTMGCYTFRQILGWKEDCQVRHMEPAMSYLLELPRILHNYTIKLVHADATGQIHIYLGAPIVASSPSRLFIRVLVRPRVTAKGHYSLVSLTQDARSIFVELLDAVAMVQAQQAKPFDCNHLYINILPAFFSDSKVMADLFLTLMAASEEKLLKVRIMEGEIRMNLAMRRDDAPDRYRFFLWNETGFVNRVAVYKEIRAAEGESPKLIAQCGNPSDLLQDGQVANAPHPLLSRLQVKRNRAHALETSYVYDFPAIFQRAVDMSWSSYGQKAPTDPLKCIELILSKNGLKEVIRPIGENDIGMVAWKMILKTPQHPYGRSIIVIANDIDFEIGSFGIAEDKLFAAASELARKNGWPRVFLSANSGARIGLAEELRAVVKVQWIDALQPNLGFEYLYLDPDDYSQLKSSVRVELIPEKGHYKITDIVTGLGVENLSGSALIASETSRAYTESFTLTFVTGRSVGIGAYLVRLGQRVIQKQSQPIILTGIQALNQLLGRDVYASNLQIGGPQIMAANGVSHLVARTDLEGVQAIVKWLDFVLCNDPKLAVSPIIPSLCWDDPDRPISYVPSSGSTQDPRLLVTGAETGEGIFLGGLLDRGSFVEYQVAWARSVIVGRGLLGGFPVAVLLVETRTTQSLIPADPASPSSEALTIPQAGQVWYPDSAYKTAQFLRDCNYGERLPLFILANWRGFSGGQRDLFDEILKFGSYIVDALREYQPPVFVYLPPGAQLRGGSWVVVDTAINPRRIEMYADPSARGGILEAEGLVAIKFRGAQLRDLLTRLIPSASSMSKAEQDKLIPLMHHVACSFADLHDRPGRMVALSVIRSVVPWREARSYFYHRLRVRSWTLQLLRRAAYLCDIKENDSGAMDQLYDDLVKVMETEWLPVMFIDPQTCKDAEIAAAMDRHHGLLEQKLNEWVRGRIANRIGKMLDAYITPAEKAALLDKLLAEDRTRSASPNR